MHRLEASLDVMSLADLLQWIGNAGKTGRCQFRNGPSIRTLYARNGRIVACSANEPHLLLGQFLLSQGRIDERTLQVCMERQEHSGRSLGDLLIETGVISEAELLRRVTAKAEETILGLFDWNGGFLRFDPDGETPAGTMAVDLDINAILFEGTRRLDEFSRLREIFPSDDIVLCATERPPDPQQVASFMGRRLYELIDGRRTVGEISLASRSSRFHAYSFLARLVEIGAAHVGRARPTKTVDSRAQEVTEALRRLVEQGQSRDAVDLVERCELTTDADEETSHLVEKAASDFLEDAYRTVTPLDAVPHRLSQLGPSDDVLPLRDLESFLLELIDGVRDVRSLIWIAPMRDVDTVLALTRLIDTGHVAMVTPHSGGDSPGTDHVESR